MLKRFSLPFLLLATGLVTGLVLSGRVADRDEVVALPAEQAATPVAARQSAPAPPPAAGPDFTAVAAQTVRASSNPALKIQGIVLTMYDRRNNLSGQVAADVRDNLGTLVYDTVIPRNVRLSEAPSHAVPALIYDRTSSGSLAYQRLAGELLARMGRTRQVETV